MGKGVDIKGAGGPFWGVHFVTGLAPRVLLRGWALVLLPLKWTLVSKGWGACIPLPLAGGWDESPVVLPGLRRRLRPNFGLLSLPLLTLKQS